MKTNIAQAAHANFAVLLQQVGACGGTVSKEAQDTQAALRRFSRVWDEMHSQAGLKAALAQNSRMSEDLREELLSMAQKSASVHLGYIQEHIEKATGYVHSEEFAHVAWQVQTQDLDRINRTVLRLKSLKEALEKVNG